MLKRLKNKLDRDGFFKTILAALKYPINFFKRRQYNEMLTKNNLKDKFMYIHENNLWASNESKSGTGSEVEYTKPIRDWLTENVPRLNINVFVDAPCGDFNWMKLVIPKLDVEYIGLDIVSSLINHNNHNYSSKNIKFNICDLTEDKIPSCDLLMIRDCLFHLSFDDINKVLKNLESTDYKYLLTTTHIVDKNFVNEDITSGDFRLIDIFKAPFSFNKLNINTSFADCPENYPIPREMILIEKKYVPNKLSMD